MTHLAVAKGVNDKLGIAKDLPSYYLGAIAPDAVHIRENFNGDMKVISHYSVEGDTWGQVVSADVWRQQAFARIHALKDNPNRDFHLGYFIHILTDAHNHDKMWLPFVEKRLAENVPFADIKGLVSEDYGRIDWIQYNSYEWTNDILNLMISTKGINVEDRVKADEIDTYKNILAKMYKQNIHFMDIINNTVSPLEAVRELPVYVSIEEILGFVEETVEEICRDI